MICRTESTYKVVFVRLYCSFRCIDAVICRFYKLPFAIVGGKIPFYGVGGLIVCDVEFRFVSFFFERTENCVESFDDGRICLVFYRNGEYVVGVIIVCDEVVLVAIY